VGQFGHNPELDEDERLRYCVEMGVQGIRLGGPKLPGDARREYEDLLALRQRVERFGLRLEVIENVPMRFLDKAVLGLPGTEEQLEHYRATIRNMGRAGIPILGYHWMPQQVWRIRPFALARGSAEVAVFDLETARLPLVGARHVFGGGAYTTRMVAERRGQLLTHGRVYTEAEMWKTWEHFPRRAAGGGGTACSCPTTPTTRRSSRLAGSPGPSAASRRSSAPRRSRTARRGGSRSASAPGRRWRADGTR